MNAMQLFPNITLDSAILCLLLVFLRCIENFYMEMYTDPVVVFLFHRCVQTLCWQTNYMCEPRA